MLLLDTNIISESRKLGTSRVDPRAAQWLSQIDVDLRLNRRVELAWLIAIALLAQCPALPMVFLKRYRAMA
jgi:hypothetical protein